jgi:hypothetical protein
LNEIVEEESTSDAEFQTGIGTLTATRATSPKATIRLSMTGKPAAMQQALIESHAISSSGNVSV